MSMRNYQEIQDQLKASGQVSSEQTAFPDKTFEQGIHAGLRWATGETNDLPLGKSDVRKQD